MGGAHVFPGGTVDDEDRSTVAAATVLDDDGELRPWRAAALRELVEETGIWLVRPGDRVPATRSSGPDVYRALAALGSRLDGTALAFFSHWVTPAGLVRRFDTRFFLAAIGPAASGSADGTEVTSSLWIRPEEALARSDAGAWDVPFPTRQHLEMLAGFGRPVEATAWARSLQSIPRIEPRLTAGPAGEIGILLPGDPGYGDRS